MGVKWTKEQQQVIDTRNSNVLVSAAAGSGKTAVLVERIINRIMDREHPVDIDRLLIVTFTRAAAGEMKERIRLAIEKELAEHEDDEHLQKQSTLLHYAQITTIDSFCAFVVKNYFHLIDLDPSYRMAEEGEIRLMQADVVSKVIDEAYEKKDAAFLRFVECFSTGKTDEGIGDMILGLYRFSVSYPYPAEWLLSCKKAYEMEEGANLEETVWMEMLKEDIKRNLEEGEKLLKEALTLCQEEGGPWYYEDALKSDWMQMQKLLETNLYEEWQQQFQNLAFARLSNKKDSQVQEEMKEKVKNLRTQEKDILSDLKKQYFEVPFSLAKECMKKAGEPVGILIDLTLQFAEKFAEKKRDKNLLDFSDLEHFALKILVDHTLDGDERTQAAKELSRRFEEVMIDEYQDSNFVQEKLLSAVSRMEEGQNNIFMVGDVKQSIYRFRLARPELFMEKFHSYSLEEGADCRRIDLHKNFRSRKEVLDGVNFLFYQIMGSSLGRVEYDKAAALYPGAVFPELETGSEKPDMAHMEENREKNSGTLPSHDTEVLLVETDEKEWQEMEAGENARELEARAVADRILEMKGNFPVLDKGTGTYRPSGYGDFVILLRSLTGWSETFRRILDARGIPVSVTTRTGYFSAIEVVTVLNYLRILDNPRQDIPMTGVLCNIPCRFSMEELAVIKCAGKKAECQGMYETLLAAEETELDEKLKGKISSFLETWRKIRGRVPYTPIHELLFMIFDETGIMDYIQANPSGEQQKANLLMLLEKSRDYEKTSYHGLFNFIRYIENLQKYQVDYGEANISSGQEDAVRIMSIHKSKGLEFPIVFVSGMGKQFNQQDSRTSLVIHPDLGVGADWVDAELRTKTPTLLKKAIQRQIQLENMGEELRILYVALTRAKEKLILTGCTAKMEKRLEGLEFIKKQKEMKISYGRLSKARSYLDWIMPALARHRCMRSIYEEYGKVPGFYNFYDGEAGFAVKIISPVSMTLTEAEEQSVQILKKNELLAFDREKVWDEEVRQKIEECFSFEYPWKDRANIPGKVTVSEIKRQYMEETEAGAMYGEEEIMPYIPSFMAQEEVVLTGAGRGTAYHRVFQCLDLTHGETVKEVEEQMDLLLAEGKITEDMRRTVRAGDVVCFVHSEVGRRMKEAFVQGKLYREQPFVLGIPASELNEEYPKEETILIQGIIDAFFYEGDNIILVDYKTDKVFYRNGRDLTDKYKVQMDYYARALERLTKKKIFEKYIYSVDLQKSILVV